MTLVFQYSSQSLLFSETNEKLLSRFLDLLLKWLNSLISCIPESRDVSCWGCNANSTVRIDSTGPTNGTRPEKVWEPLI